MASVTITLSSDGIFVGAALTWGNSSVQAISLGESLSIDGMTEIWLHYLQFPRTSSIVFLRLQDHAGPAGSPGLAGPDFSDDMEMEGTITVTASDGVSVTITGISDATEPYGWTPSNIVDVRAFTNHVSRLPDQSLTVTFDDNVKQSPPPSLTTRATRSRGRRTKRSLPSPYQRLTANRRQPTR